MSPPCDVTGTVPTPPARQHSENGFCGGRYDTDLHRARGVPGFLRMLIVTSRDPERTLP
jgi:hypothetical protein